MSTATQTGIAGATCPLCGEVGQTQTCIDGIPVRACECGILLAWDHESEDAYERLYTEDCRYHVAEQRANGQVPYADAEREHYEANVMRLRVLSAFTQRKPGASLLDVGTALGGLVHVADVLAGWGAEGIEPNPEIVREARQMNRNVRQGTWRDVEGQWDIITLIDVFEHLTRPMECLRTLRAHLKPGGMLVIEMPEWDGPHQRLHGWLWKHIRPRQHICLYSERAATALFSRLGLIVEGIHRPLRGRLGKVTYYVSTGGHLDETG